MVDPVVAQPTPPKTPLIVAVVDGFDQPLADVEVEVVNFRTELAGGSNDVKKMTNAQGRAEFGLVDPRIKFDIKVRKSGGFGPPGNPFTPGENRTVRPAQLKGKAIELKLTRNVARLIVEARDATAQIPLAGASIGVDGRTGTPMPLSGANGRAAPFFEVPVGEEIRFHAEKANFGPQPGGTPFGGQVVATHTFADGETFVALMLLHQAPLVTPRINQAKLVLAAPKPNKTRTRRSIVLSIDAPFDGLGKVSLAGSGSVRFFDAATSGHEVFATTRGFTAAELQSGFELFVEGATATDTNDGLTLTLTLTGGTKTKLGPAKTAITVVDVSLDICQSRTSAADPVPLSQAAKVDPGRFVQRQAGLLHPRAKLIVGKVTPPDFTGTLVLSKMAGAGGLSLFKAADEVPHAGQVPLPASHEFPAASVGAGLAFFAEGTAASGGPKDTGYQLGIKGVEPDCDHVVITVYAITQIDATQARSPCRGAAGAPMPPQSSTTTNKTFSPADIAIVRGSVDVELTATVTPAGVPVSWHVERAADDPASLGALPTHSAVAGTTNRRKLTSNATGSFHVFAFHDANGSGKPEHADQPMVFNLSIVNIELTGNQVFSRNTQFVGGVAGASLSVASGLGVAPATDPYTDAEFLRHAFAAKAIVKLTGGSANLRRGTDRIRLGFLQATSGDSFTGTYADGRTVREVIVANAAVSSPIVGGPPGTPALLPFPVRDTQNGPGNSGATSFITGSSDAEKTDLPGGGMQRICRMIDSPAVGLPLSHPISHSALASIAGTNDFSVFLSAFSIDFNETYTVAASTTWSARYGTFVPPSAWNNTAATITASAAMLVHNPPVPSGTLAAERCPPDFVPNFKLDAR